MSCSASRVSAVAMVTAFYFVPVPAWSQPSTPAAIAPATSFVTIGEKPAIVYDSPSAKGNRTLVLSRLSPLEVLVKLDKWTKIRDAEGSVGWVENGVLGERRHVQIVATVAEVRASASPAALLVFEAQRGVLLEVTGTATDGWIPVKHRDGQSGLVRASQVWGG